MAFIRHSSWGRNIRSIPPVRWYWSPKPLCLLVAIIPTVERLNRSRCRRSTEKLVRGDPELSSVSMLSAPTL